MDKKYGETKNMDGWINGWINGRMICGSHTNRCKSDRRKDNGSARQKEEENIFEPDGRSSEK